MCAGCGCPIVARASTVATAAAALVWVGEDPHWLPALGANGGGRTGGLTSQDVTQCIDRNGFAWSRVALKWEPGLRRIRVVHVVRREAHG